MAKAPAITAGAAAPPFALPGDGARDDTPGCIPGHVAAVLAAVEGG